MTNPIGYAGLEDPMNLYSPTAVLPVVYTGGYQVRQFSAGRANTLGAAVAAASILNALYSPPDSKITTAAGHSVANAMNLYTVTQHDLDNYAAPVLAGGSPGLEPSWTDEGGTP